MASDGGVPITIRAWRCVLAAPGSDQVSISAWEGTVEGLAASSAGGPATFIVKVTDLAPFKEIRTRFVDRGRKHPAKALSTLLVGHEEIPIIDGQFTLSGQLERSVRTLLQGAAKSRDRNVYVVGVADRLFAAMRFKAREPLTPTRRSLAKEEGSVRPSDFLKWIAPAEVPESLCRKLVGNSPEMQFFRQMIVLASQQKDPVLILGDTGTGKEVAARAIHDLDPARRHFSFLAVNCGGISPELFEAELFGYQPGAFTGALRHGKDGLWTAAGKGTLFLDEIGDLPMPNQVKILRALESGEIRRVGSNRIEPAAECRVIAATNRDLHGMVQAGTFREDLYYRLSPIRIPAPRLRDHPQDISLLAKAFWEKEAPGRPPLSRAVIAALESYRWPGNARELRAVLVGLSTMGPKGTLHVDNLRAVFQLRGASRLDDEGLGAADDARVHRVECLRHLRRADEVIRACKVVLRPFATRPGDEESVRRVRMSLSHRLAELHLLITQPLMFHSIGTFDVVQRLVGGLVTCQSLIEGDGSEARRYWKKSLGAEVTATLSTIMIEVEKLLKKL